MHIGASEHVTPCAIVKLPLSPQNQQTTSRALPVPITFGEKDRITNCFMVDNNRTMLVTENHITLLDDKFKQIVSHTKDTLHKDVKAIRCCELNQSDNDKTGYVFVCDVKDMLAEIQAKQPSHIHKIERSSFSSWLLSVSIKAEQDKLELEYDSDFSSSLYIEGDDVRSLIALSETRLMITCYMSDMVLQIDDWTVTKQIELKEKMIFLNSCMLLPDFDLDEFPFVVLCAKDTYDLLNLKTGVTSKLIQGSSGGHNKYPSTFFMDPGNGRFGETAYGSPP